jgi:hypothetical protein
MRRRAVVNDDADPETLGGQMKDKMPVTPWCPGASRASV